MSRIALTLCLSFALTACGVDATEPGVEGPVIVSPEINGDFDVVDPHTSAASRWMAWEWEVTVFLDAGAVRFTHPEGTDYIATRLLSHRFQVTSGTDYEFSFDGRGLPPDTYATVAWFDDLNQCLKDDAGACAETRVPVAESAEYQRFSAVASVPSTERRAYGEISFEVPLAVGGAAYIDNVQLIAQ